MATRLHESSVLLEGISLKPYGADITK